MPMMAEKLTLLSPSARLGAFPLFRAHGTAYTVDDAVAWAAFRGDLEVPIGETLALAAAEESAERQDLAVDGDAAQAASERFRYEHELISAGETESWLESRGMTADDFGRWIYQRLCLDRGGAEEQGEAPGDFPELLRIHLWLSDVMDLFAKDLRRRVAASFERPAGVSSAPAVKRFVDAHRFDAMASAEWLSALGRDRQWLDSVARMEAAYETLTGEVLSDQARTRKLASNRLVLVRIEVETLALESEDAAREAVLCVHDDGVSLAAVARDAGYHADRVELWVGEIASTTAQRLLGGTVGEVVGPIERDGRFDVYQLVRKIEPSLADPAVGSRVDAALIDDCFDELCSRHTE